MGSDLVRDKNYNCDYCAVRQLMGVQSHCNKAIRKLVAPGIGHIYICDDCAKILMASIGYEYTSSMIRDDGSQVELWDHSECKQ